MTAAVLAAAASVHPIRRLTGRLPDRLSGLSDHRHVALTFDDGPDRDSTPHFFDLLASRDVRAAFFVLGRHAAEEPQMLRRIAREGHELAVHGWTHNCVALVRPGRLRAQPVLTRDLVENLTQTTVRCYRPPYGVLTPNAQRAAASVGLEIVLSLAWGRAGEPGDRSHRVLRAVRRDLRPGGTVLLHDTDRTSAKDSWRVTLAATDLLLRAQPAPFGPLREHWG
jgi:peptidoglycan/xylan/chitin deacetylase (PgdA/CDA1 family)